MSNRDQRTSPPEDYRDDLPEPSQSGLSEELVAVLKLLATQKSLIRGADEQDASPARGQDEARRLGRDLSALHAQDPSAAIDRLQNEISALNGLAPVESREYPGDEWDSSAAEALTRLYETSAFVPTPGIPYLEEASQTGSGNVPFYAVAPEPTRRNNRDWLEKRFADIAAKLDSSLAEIRDSSPVHRLDGRLETMEARICEALQGLVTRSDLERFSPAGSRFETMAGNIDRAAAQLSRLDTIEGNLETVLDRLSDDRLYTEASSSGQHQIDFKALADATADSVVARLSQLGLGRVDTAELAEIRQSIDVIIDERRSHDEQSIAILDTLQQAMISVLDRVDALSRPQPTNADNDKYRDRAGTQSLRADMAGDDDPYVSSSAFDEDKGGDTATETRRGSLDGADEDFLAQAYPQPPDLPRDLEPSDDDLGIAMSGTDVLEPSAVDRIRQELIAEAKRARQQAAERPAKTQEAVKTKKPASGSKPKSDAVLQDGAATAKNRPSRQSPGRFTTASANGTIFGIQRRKLLVGAVIILFTTAGALMLLRATSGTPSEEPASIEQPLDGASKAAIGSPAHVPDSSPEASAGTAQQPAGSGQNDGADTRDRAAEPGQTGRMDTTPHLHDGPLADPTRSVASNLSGVTVQNTARTLTPAELAHLGERQAMAHFSTKLGEAAVQATPAALFPQGATVSPANQHESGSVVGSRKPLDLPPASVGPMSLRLAAAQGDQSAEFEVGARLAEGKGTQQDFKEAARWYQRSAAQGFAQAQYRLGTLYERGLGTPKDLARAAVWYQRAAENGNLKAMHNLAVLSSGQGAAEPDYETAARWFTSAAERGLADSQYNLAVLFANGLGTPKDMKKAYMYFALAAKAGDAEAKRRQETLRAELSVEELGDAERMAEIWRRKPSDRIANDARAAGEDWKSRADNGYNG